MYVYRYVYVYVYMCICIYVYCIYCIAIHIYRHSYFRDTLISRNSLDPRLAKYSRILFFTIYIHAKLASGSAESLQNLRSRETTWLRLTCEIRASEAITFTRPEKRGGTSCGARKRGRISCPSGRWVTRMTLELFSLDRVHTNLR